MIYQEVKTQISKNTEKTYKPIMFNASLSPKRCREIELFLYLANSCPNREIILIENEEIIGWRN